MNVYKESTPFGEITVLERQHGLYTHLNDYRVEMLWYERVKFIKPAFTGIGEYEFPEFIEYRSEIPYGHKSRESVEFARINRNRLDGFVNGLCYVFDAKYTSSKFARGFDVDARWESYPPSGLDYQTVKGDVSACRVKKDGTYFLFTLSQTRHELYDKQRDYELFHERFSFAYPDYAQGFWEGFQYGYGVKPS